MNAPVSNYDIRNDTRFHNEASMLGYIIGQGSPAAYQLARDIVQPEMFNDAFLGDLFARIGVLAGQGLSGFKLTQRLMLDIQGHPALLEIGMEPSKMIARLVSMSSPAIAIEGDARQIKYDWLKDRLKVAVEAEDNAEAEEIASEMDGLSKAHLDRAKDRVGALEAIGSVLDRINDVVRDGIVTDDTIYPGSKTLVHAIGGWRRKRFYVIGGRPGMGKTTVGLSWLMRTAGKGGNVLFFSLEMGADELAERALSDLAWSRERRIEYKDISRNQVSAATLETLYGAQRRLEKLPLVIDDRPGLTLAQIRSACLQEKQRLEGTGGRLDVVCIDHMGLVRASERYSGNKVAETEEISAGLKILAKELDVAVIALMQLNRGVEGREDKRPSLADLRWSGAIEQDADAVMFCYREAYYLQNRKCDNDADESDRLMRLAEVKDRLEIIVAKQRGGETAILDFYCDMGCAAVRDLEYRQ